MAKSSNANTFDVVKVGKPYRDAEGNFLGYTEQEIAREIWEQQQSLPEEERNPHFRGMKPLEEVKDRLLTPKTMPLMQSPQPRNPAEELITVVSDLQSRLSALEDENRQLKGAGGGANLTLARCARRLLAMNRKFCPRERSVGKLSVYGLAFLFVIIGNNLAEGVGTFDGLADTSSLETLGGRLYT